METAVVLVVREGDRRTRELRYESPATLTFGRGVDCAIVLEEVVVPPKLSRHHCELKIESPRVWVRDLGSKNGTYVGSQRVEASPEGRPVAGGDRILLGDVVIEVQVRVKFSCTSCKQVWEEKIAGSAVPVHTARVCLDCSQVAFRESLGDQGPQDAKTDGPPTIPGYQVERELGRGAMGVVYLAKKGDLPIALKVIRPENAGDARQRELFVREATLARQLKHPNIVEMYDAGEHAGALWMATEFCSGGNLEAYQEELPGRKVPIPQAVGFIIQALRGLEFAHGAEFDGFVVEGQAKQAKGLVHRDFKPQNLLLGGPNGDVVKIADYGLAKAYELASYSGLTRTGDVGGTPFFMSRWQCQNYKYAGPEVDVWSAAASLYWMITGLPPREFDNPSTWMNTVMRSMPTKIRVRNSDVNDKLARVIDSALFDMAEPSFDSAREFREALESVPATSLVSPS